MAKKVEYSKLITFKKLIIQILIWGLPQLLAFLIAHFSLESMSVAGVLSFLIGWLVDWLKHR